MPIMGEYLPLHVGTGFCVGVSPYSYSFTLYTPCLMDTTVLTLAYAAHRDGRLEDAERGYRETLVAHPDDADALHLLGVLHHQRGHHAEAVELMRRAVKVRPDDAGMQLNLGNALRAMGLVGQAIEHFRNALTLAPDFPLAHYNLGNACAQLGRHEEAKEAFERAVRLQPYDAASHNNLGNAWYALGNYTEAIDAFHRVLRLRPRHAGAHNNLGMALGAMGDMRGAVAQFRAALQAEPRFVAAHFNLGNAFEVMGDHARAVAAFSAALQLQPHFVPALFGAGNALAAMGQYEPAIQAFERALGIEPDFALAWSALGTAYHALGRNESALRAFDEALRVRPDLAAAHLNRALVWLTLGDFRRGLPEYEWRLNPADNDPQGDVLYTSSAVKLVAVPAREEDAASGQRVSIAVAISAPRWQGEPLAGRTLLVRAEPGLGDTLQFVRFIPVILAQASAAVPRGQPGARIVLEVQPALLALLSHVARAWRGVTVVPRHSPDLVRLAADYQCPLLSLPLALGLTLDTLPAPTPWLSAPPEYLQKWRTLPGGKGKRKVGIAWSDRGQNNATLALPFAALDPLFALPGIDWIVLQTELSERDTDALAQHPRAASIHLPGDPDRPFADFSDIAAVIEGLDAVVSIDSAVAHLAGALGKPLWLMLPFAADWRWFTGTHKSPWYASAHLVRQSHPGADARAWQGVVTEVARALREKRE